jgi:hypothetical protein
LTEGDLAPTATVASQRNTAASTRVARHELVFRVKKLKVEYAARLNANIVHDVGVKKSRHLNLLSI